ncbi:SDR family oxidoreductase [Actinoalloteichus spitiensis]|uniref:SDR family oxidoreductase n=1 Tax=Actinoalloteichus spitiensis TaxID=252394 RepID=UPI0003737A0D|nr:SDR family oxidoreductase [Actinoalloteichus spitiensis]
MTGLPSPAELRPTPLPLLGRSALVTAVSRRAGIGYAVARRLAALGADLFLHHHLPHDERQPWGADPGGVDAVVSGVAECARPGGVVAHGDVDLAQPAGPAEVTRTAVECLGHVDVLVCNQALSGSDGALDVLEAADLDAHFAVNARASLLLAQAFGRQHDGRPGGRIVFLTSGQDLGVMRNEIAYATSKGALAAITPSLADHFADRGITVNAVNPGPVDTGYAPPAAHEEVRRRFPGGAWGGPDDPARLISWLVGDDGRWVTGQVINSEGGFRRG